jgi:Trk K+ transport system NAD-binding subunit
MFIAGIVGVKLANDPKKYALVSWMPYLTQAGVAIGLSTIISHEFPAWGTEFETIVIAIIIFNQLIGPPLFKWVLKYLKESHREHKNNANEDKIYNALIFSLDSNSIELAKQLKKHNWNVKIVTSLKKHNVKDIEIIQIRAYKTEHIKNLPMKDCDSIILLHPKDKINFEIGVWIYENVGTKNLIASANSANYIEEFKNINILTIQPKLAMISLMDHMVRSRNAITLLLGLDSDKDTIDVELKNKDLDGLLIRELSIPSEVSILSIKRRGNTIISHGYTMLRLGDILTVIGSEYDLNNMINKFEE